MNDKYSLNTLEELNDVIMMLRWRSDESEEHEKLALKCIQKAQFFKDIDAEFEARMAYVSIVTHLNKDDQAIAMFPWLLKKCDEDRERFDYRSTLWAYKWVISDVKDFANIPLKKVEALQADMEKRFRDFGAGEKVLHYFRFQYYDTIGRPDKASEEYQLYLTATKDYVLADCAACQPNNSIPHLLYQQKYEEVFQIAEPIIQGNMSCRTVPETTYPKLLVAAMMLHRWNEVENYAFLARKNIKVNRANLDTAAYLLTYYAVKEDFVKGRNLVEKQYPFLSRASEVARFTFCLSATIFFTKFNGKGKKKLKMKLPAENNLYKESGEYLIEEVLSHFNHLLYTAANALDKRNENNHYCKWIETMNERVKAVDEVFPR